MSQYVNDMWPGSPQKASPPASDSGRSSGLSSRSRSRSSSRNSRPDSRGSSRSASRSQPRRSRRSRSRSRSRRRHQRRCRRYSRSYSRSRSRSRSRRHRDSRYGRPRRCYQPRSRSRGRSHGRRPSYALTRGRRYYGFGRTVYPEEHGRWRPRSRSRSRSRSRASFRLSEKDRMELLEIAKANAAKALGTTNFDLPASLRAVIKETSHGTAVASNGTTMEVSEKQTEDKTKSPSEKSSPQRTIAFSSNNSVAKPVQKIAKSAAETSSGPPKIDKKKSPYGLWIPV